MQIQITKDGVAYNNFTEIMRINEIEEYALTIAVKDDAGTAYNFTAKTVAAKLVFVNVADNSSIFELNATVASLATGTFTVDLKNALTTKGGKVYFVYWYLDNQTDSRQYEINVGRLIIDDSYLSS